MDQNQITELRGLIELLKANDVAEFDIEQPDFKVRLKFVGAPVTSAIDLTHLSHMAALAAPNTGVAQAIHSGQTSGEQDAAERAQSGDVPVLHTVKSPIVGTFYESPSPGASSFVKIGDQIEVGQVLCIIEAMKLMNEIEADVSGEVVKRIASSGQPVEYGQALFTIRPR